MTARKPKATAPEPVEAAPVEAEPVEEPLPVEYPPRDASIQRPDIVAPEPEVTQEAELPPASPAGLFFVTDSASFYPVRYQVDDKPFKAVKGVLYPFQDTAEIGRLLTTGAIRMATDEDKRKSAYATTGPGGSLTSASMQGVGIKRQ